MADRVAPEGARAARLVLIGEAPGRWEMTYGRPFVGPSYTDKLLPWWQSVGLRRENFYIDNVLDYQPTNINAVPAEELHVAMAALHARLAQLDNPWLIVPTGNVALYALTGKGRVSFHQRDGRWLRPGITEWRGSILEYEDQRGRRIKTIPTIHPAALFRHPAYERPCRADWARIAGDAAFRELRLPERTHLTAPSRAEALEWLGWALHEARMLSMDIETPKRVEYEVRQRELATGCCRGCTHTKARHLPPTAKAQGTPAAVSSAVPGEPAIRACRGPKKGEPCLCAAYEPPFGKPTRTKIEEEPYLGCVGYSFDPKLSMTIPTTLAYWQDPAVLAEVRAVMGALHAAPCEKVLQNGAYDCYWLATEGLPVAGFAWDTMKMHRVLAPADEQHDLAYQASLYTRQPYWKDEAKDPDSIARYASNSEALWHYNGIDACVTAELGAHHHAALAERGRLDYYRRMEGALIEPLLTLSLHGVRVDGPGRAAEYDRVRLEAAALAKEINAAAGTPLVAKLAASPARLKAWLYGELRLPEQYTKTAKGEKVVSTNIVAIKRLMERFPGEARLAQIGPMILRHRRLNTIASFTKMEHVSPDGRVRALFESDTLLGRLKSTAPPRGVGRGLQNIDRKLRRFFVPDEAA